MDSERRRNRRFAVDPDGTNAVLRGTLPVAVRDISPGGLRLALGSALAAGGVYPLTALLSGLSLAAPVRITRCRPGDFASGFPGANAESWEAGAEFLWRDEADAAVVRRWLERRAPVAS